MFLTALIVFFNRAPYTRLQTKQLITRNFSAAGFTGRDHRLFEMAIEVAPPCKVGDFSAVILSQHFPDSLDQVT